MGGACVLRENTARFCVIRFELRSLCVIVCVGESGLSELLFVRTLLCAFIDEHISRWTEHHRRVTREQVRQKQQQQNSRTARLTTYQIPPEFSYK